MVFGQILVYRVGNKKTAPKNPPSKTKKKHLKIPTSVFFWGFIGFFLKLTSVFGAIGIIFLV
jgi:hypothetical protein